MSHYLRHRTRLVVSIRFSVVSASMLSVKNLFRQALRSNVTRNPAAVATSGFRPLSTHAHAAGSVGEYQTVYDKKTPTPEISAIRNLPSSICLGLTAAQYLISGAPADIKAMSYGSHINDTYLYSTYSTQIFE